MAYPKWTLLFLYGIGDRRRISRGKSGGCINRDNIAARWAHLEDSVSAKKKPCSKVSSYRLSLFLRLKQTGSLQRQNLRLLVLPELVTSNFFPSYWQINTLNHGNYFGYSWKPRVLAINAVTKELHTHFSAEEVLTL